MSSHRETVTRCEGSGEITVGLVSEPVCVVITDDGIAEDEVRRRLGNSLPLRIVSWGDQNYLTIISALRPAVIVVLGADEGLLQNRCKLVASLFSNLEPTVISAKIADASEFAPELLIEQLGAGTAVQIASLSDLKLP